LVTTWRKQIFFPEVVRSTKYFHGKVARRSIRDIKLVIINYLLIFRATESLFCDLQNFDFLQVRVYNWFANRRKEDAFKHKLAMDTSYPVSGLPMNILISKQLGYVTSGELHGLARARYATKKREMSLKFL